MDNWNTFENLQLNNITLAPLKPEHADGIIKAASDGELWNLWYTSVPSPSAIEQYMKTAFRQRDNGKSWPLVVIDLDKNEIIGSTRYCNIEANNRRLEIGYTFYAASYQRTAVNTTCKYLLLKYAFEKLNAIAVELRTHWHNQRSRAAILRLGAKQDGVLRNHRIDHNGLLRDTAVFSIIRDEWPTVKHHLQFRLNL